MKILLDHCTPRPLRQFLEGHDVKTASEQGWRTLRNGDLLNAAEKEGFNVFITADKKMENQQNLAKRAFGTIILSNGDWYLVRPHTAILSKAVQNAKPGTQTHVEIPGKSQKRKAKRQEPDRDRGVNIRKKRRSIAKKDDEERPQNRIVFEERSDGRFDIKQQSGARGSLTTLTSTKSIREGLFWLRNRGAVTTGEIPTLERDLLEDLKRRRERGHGR